MDEPNDNQTQQDPAAQPSEEESEPAMPALEAPTEGGAVAAVDAERPAAGEEADAPAQPAAEAGPAAAATAGDDVSPVAGGDEATGSAAGDAPSAGAEPEVGDGSAEAEEGGMSMMELLMSQGDYFPGQFQRGDVVEGTVVRKDKNQLVLDIGAKQEGIVPASDLLRMPEGYLEGVNVGDPIKGVIMRPEGEIVVSIHQVLTMEDWDRAREHLDAGDIVELEIVGFNKGGAIVQFGNLQGFIPRSHLSEPGGRGADDDAEVARRLVGRRIPVKIIEVSRRKRRLIMSERQALREWRATRKQRLMETLREGAVIHGRVSSVRDFGAFVDLGGADGLVHVSEMTHERGKHPRDIVREGQEVDVYVLSIDREHNRIGLSMKRLQSDPWSSVEQAHYVGELVEVTISNLTKFGAFARLDDGLEGLIHISELSDDHIEHPREAVRSGQRATVEIIAIDPRHKRIGLSIKRVPPQLRTQHDEPAPAPEPDSAPVGAVSSPPAASADDEAAAAGAGAPEPATASAAESADATAADEGASDSGRDDEDDDDSADDADDGDSDDDDSDDVSDDDSDDHDDSDDESDDEDDDDSADDADDGDSDDGDSDDDDSDDDDSDDDDD